MRLPISEIIPLYAVNIVHTFELYLRFKMQSVRYLLKVHGECHIKIILCMALIESLASHLLITD